MFYPGGSVGLRNVGSYQISGHPYLSGGLLNTGEEKFVDFPNVTREFTVINSGSTGGSGPVLRVHFNSIFSGNVISGRHYVTLDKDNQSMTFHTKCSRVYISCTEQGGGDSGFEVIANLTNIDASHMYELSGTGLDE